MSLFALAISCALSIAPLPARGSRMGSSVVTSPSVIAGRPSPAAQTSEIDGERKACRETPSAALGAECGGIEVVDGAGLPVANAKVTWSDGEASEEMIRQHPSAVWSWSGVTNGRGRVFAKELALGPGLLEVEAPTAIAGRCAGLSQKPWSGRPTLSSVRVVLKVRPVTRSDVRGRVVDGAGHGIEGAREKLL